VQFSLYVSRRKWWKFLSYSMNLPPLLIEVAPHQETFDTIERALAQFHAKFDEALDHIRSLKAEHDGPRIAAAKVREAAEEAAARGEDGLTPGERWLRENGRIA
jgi:hypothetical protein